ncbi:sensor histidine kinase [Pedobacter sp. HMWF019]|uniref:sensor histidine kinase n=1 Tax=Pedobacter sp. HMWF019 TaxID=2056856 RepID=UPI000D39EAB1|nr:histidine kinase [Pedobacter sp. HMWF019]PTS92286.1 sensor histidine kinase [Pedobacter sp. HMWF019]
MKNLNESTKIELWIATALIVIIFIFSTIQAVSIHNFPASIPYQPNYWLNTLFRYIIVATCYFLLALFVKPELKKKDTRPSNAIFFVYILIQVCVFANLIDHYLLILLSVKMIANYFSRDMENKKNQLHSDVTVLLAISMFLQACSVLLNNPIVFRAAFSFILPIAIANYAILVFAVIPNLIHKKYRILKFIGYSLLTTILSLGILVLLFSIFDSINNGNVIELLMGINPPIQLFLVPIFAWNIYKSRNRKNIEEIATLKTELGKSDATLNFLKSQINPHFLFNALNTLYGTALQENAERTSEGIQKLGDMMRFMLQENLEDKISLSRDVEYLKNYIDLQKLRTSVSTDITIETQIEEQLNELQIAPMLLIPFVENAFKHGISLQYPSHIKITLQNSSDTLYFDVYNSIHLKSINDPEKFKSGIGLQNVKQRLALLYPEKHELIIRENAKEFFIHLTLQL